VNGASLKVDGQWLMDGRLAATGRY
jgi:hypothetical protein